MGVDGENCNWFQDLVLMVGVGRWGVHFGWAESISGIGLTDRICYYVCHHLGDDQYNRSETSQNPVTTIHILKSVDDSYSNIKRAKYKDNEKDDDKDTLTEGLYMCYIC